MEGAPARRWVTHSGRFRADADPLQKLTNSAVIEAIATQLPDWFRAEDFVPVPCCSPSCRSATFALYDGADLVPLPRLVDVEPYLDYVTNRAVPDLVVREALEGLWSAKAAGGSAPVAARCLGDRPRRPADPVLRLQLGRLPEQVRRDLAGAGR